MTSLKTYKESKKCNVCNKDSKNHCCSGIYYCSKSCQKADWQNHSKFCKKKVKVKSNKINDRKKVSNNNLDNDSDEDKVKIMLGKAKPIEICDAINVFRILLKSKPEFCCSTIELIRIYSDYCIENKIDFKDFNKNIQNENFFDSKIFIKLIKFYLKNNINDMMIQFKIIEYFKKSWKKITNEDISDDKLKECFESMVTWLNEDYDVLNCFSINILKLELKDFEDTNSEQNDCIYHGPIFFKHKIKDD